MSTLKSNNEDMTINADGASSEIILQQNATERMRIDSSGKVLVGNDTGALATAGVSLRQNWIRSVRDGDIALQLNRLTSDGDIAQFRKDGTTVGSIGTTGGQIHIAGTTNGIRFGGQLEPTNSAGSRTDDSVDLGSSTYRFQDAYLSGGVYLGGTGSANKLDDYEEGTWTPVIADSHSGGNTGTYDSGAGSYTKIGRAVTVSCEMNNLDITGMTGSNDLVIRGFPYTSIYEGGLYIAVGSLYYHDIDRNNSRGDLSVAMTDSKSGVSIRECGDAVSDTILNVNQISGTSADIYFTITYFAA